ncbi:hypothetical protein DL95DRAFT_400680 [Leptodontidium sp. 2 PMI_412]|nr:hypothetical protein DL95DRAFT_400680 [Leptodontidium sp. 2 PMI_412]
MYSKSEPGTFGEEKKSEILVGPREATAEIKRLKREFRRQREMKRSNCLGICKEYQNTSNRTNTNCTEADYFGTTTITSITSQMGKPSRGRLVTRITAPIADLGTLSPSKMHSVWQLLGPACQVAIFLLLGFMGSPRTRGPLVISCMSSSTTDTLEEGRSRLWSFSYLSGGMVSVSQLLALILVLAGLSFIELSSLLVALCHLISISYPGMNASASSRKKKYISNANTNTKKNRNTPPMIANLANG